LPLSRSEKLRMKKINNEEMKVKNKYCDRCGKSLGLVYPNTKYCDNCRREKHNEESRKYHKRKICSNCGVPCYGTLCQKCFNRLY